MDFNQVRYFLALADTLNFTRASEKCYVSQPALTQAIKRLEDELGGELILRKGRDTELTGLGKSLKMHFEQIEHTRNLVHSTAKAVIDGEILELNIGVMCTIGPGVIAGMFDHFQMEHPMVSITLHDVVPESIPDLLLSGALDGAFLAYHDKPHPKLQHIELFEENMVITFNQGHKFNQATEITLADIAKENYIDRLHCEFRSKMLDLFAEHKLDLNVVLSSQREDWIQSLVRDGLGISLIPQYSLLQPGLKQFRVTNPAMSRVVEFATAPNNQTTSMLNELISHIQSFKWPGN